jgi:uncharacterized protein (DUF427 family)
VGLSAPAELEDSDRRVKVVFGGVTLAYTTRAKRVLETSHPPVYYIPPDDIRMEHLRLAEGTSFVSGRGLHATTTSRPKSEGSVGLPGSIRSRCPAYAELKDCMAFYPSLMDACWVDGEKVRAQEGDFYGGWVTSDIVGPLKGGPGTRGW